MATELQNQVGVPENLRKQLAVAVRSIQWSYAIFWSVSTRQPGVLEWGDGYYNGDIKTRKTVQAVELNADQLGLQRSEQLRELYESLADGESNPQAKRPSAALSQKISQTRSGITWFACRSFSILAKGRTLANGQPIWLCNAHNADSKGFSRSLLAKSASIKTVVCFPFLGGVIELGVTELVLEDPGLIQHIKTSFLEIPYPIVSREYHSSVGNKINDKDPTCAELDHDFFDTKLNAVVECEELNMVSPNNSSNGFGLNQPVEDSFMVEGINGGASQVQSWQFMDDDFSNCVYNSMNSSDCISQTFVDTEKVVPIPKCERVNDHSLPDVRQSNHAKLTSLDLRNDDFHYTSVLSALLKSSDQLVLGPHFKNCNKASSFVSWKKGGLVGTLRPGSGTSQTLLKKVVFEVARMHGDHLFESRDNNGRNDGIWRPEADEINMNHALSERRRREKLNERFVVLGSLVPSKSKADKVSILDDTIEYVKELERRVEELESCRELTELEAARRIKSQDTVERTCDNYGNNKTSNGKKPLINKRKACDIDETEPEINRVLLKDSSSSDNITVSMIEKDVVIEMRCPWRECLLLEIMDAVSNLRFDSHSVQSSTIDGILSVTIKSKLKGSTVTSAAMIRQALQRVVHKH
nr:basic helix-loop-helix transcription factor [Loropetalum chinense var. rubrum]